jgi:hypothetical protein
MAISFHTSQNKTDMNCFKGSVRTAQKTLRLGYKN